MLARRPMHSRHRRQSCGVREVSRLGSLDAAGRPAQMSIGFVERGGAEDAAWSGQTDTSRAFAAAFCCCLKARTLMRESVSMTSHQIADYDPQRFEQLFRQVPAQHRFPAAMATRLKELCRSLVETYDADSHRLDHRRHRTRTRLTHRRPARLRPTKSKDLHRLAGQAIRRPTSRLARSGRRLRRDRLTPLGRPRRVASRPSARPGRRGR
jgi:hypothetical protein